MSKDLSRMTEVAKKERRNKQIRKGSSRTYIKRYVEKSDVAFHKNNEDLSFIMEKTKK